MDHYPYGALKTIEEVEILVAKAFKEKCKIPIFSFNGASPHIEKIIINSSSRISPETLVPVGGNKFLYAERVELSPNSSPLEWRKSHWVSIL